MEKIYICTTTNWIELYNSINWNDLYATYQIDPEHFSMDTSIHIIRTDHYWEKIHFVIDVCPYDELIKCLAISYMRVESWSSYFRKTFSGLQSVLYASSLCSKQNNRDIFLENVLFEWNKIEPCSPIMQMIFDSHMLFSYLPDGYKQVVETIYHIMPQEVTNYFKSEEGQIFWRTIKRLQSGGFLAEDIVNIIEDIVIRQIGLQPIEFEPVNVSLLFERLGWKKLEDRKNDDIDKTKIIDILEIGEMCYLTKPCQHDVILLMQDGSKITKILNMNEINEICSDLNIDSQVKWRCHI